ncbi:MAG: HAMP domain-containing sensor histidine kinase, partial [Burkholderiaceae bacterium]
SDQLKNEFLAMLAHELRNPLAPLRNGLEILRLKGDDAATVARLRLMMDRQLGQLVHLVNDLMDVTRISNGKIVLQRQRTDLNDVLATAIETTQPLIDAKGHRLDRDFGDAALLVDVDAVRIAQVISNLLSNAVKYTPPGGHIALSARRVGAETVVRVIDNGIGIPADSLESIFEMFAQIPAAANGVQAGLGIGLGLVRRLVELHGGTVSAASTLGAGSTLTIRLPLVDVAAEAAEPTT